MTRGTRLRVLGAVIGTLLLAVFAVACGGGNSSSESGETGASTTPAEEAGGGQEGGVAAAAEAIEPYIGQPSPFPVTEDLKEIPKGATFAYMNCGNPYCSLLGELMEPAAQTLGVKLEQIKIGFAANTVSAGFDTVVSKEPDAVIIPAVEPELYSKQLKELQAKNIPVVSTGVVKAEEYGIESPQYAAPQFEVLMKLMADYVAAEFGDESNVSWYGIPELAFTKLSEEAFEKELEANCPKCSVRFASTPIATIGNTAANSVVSDLQAHPETDVAVFEAGEIEIGLPQALKAAGIQVKTLSTAPIPSNLQSVKEGTETASLATDAPILAWSLLDQAAREAVGQELAGLQAEGLAAVYQFLTQEDITFDASKGWTGYPDFAERFAKLWGVSG